MTFVVCFFLGSITVLLYSILNALQELNINLKFAISDSERTNLLLKKYFDLCSGESKE